MSDIAGRPPAALYDHEIDQRDKSVVDWGADELFARPGHNSPSERFRRPRAESARTTVHELASMSVRGSDGSVLVRSASPAERVRAAPGSPPRRALAGLSASAPGSAGHVVGSRAPESAGGGGLVVAEGFRGGVAASDGIRSPVVVEGFRGGVAASDGGRSSRVVITGRPEARIAGSARSRPPLSVADRVSARPERIMGWAFALGLLLILIAYVTG